jgi:hypothetical protein
MRNCALLLAVMCSACEAVYQDIPELTRLGYTDIEKHGEFDCGPGVTSRHYDVTNPNGEKERLVICRDGTRYYSKHFLVNPRTRKWHE